MLKSYGNPFVKKTLYLLLIIVITFIVYTPARNGKFTNWDDQTYVTNNKDIASFQKNKSRLLTKSYHGNYHPLTMLSLAYDYSTGKLNPKVYHRTSILLHLINAALVFWLIILITNNLEIGLICGMLFGVHPLHVESAAWIAERKNVLYALFFLASLIAYIKFLKEEKLKFYFVALLLFILSLLSKGVAVSLTISLIAIDYLFSRNLLSKKVILEKIPFFALSILFGLIAINVQPVELSEIDTLRAQPLQNPLYERFLYATYNTGEYIVKLFIPFKLAAFYPYPEKNNGTLPLQYYILPFLIIISLVAGFVILIKRKDYYSRLILFCFLFFIINIALVLQLLPVGDAIMADRYTYIPSIGIFLLIGVFYKYITENKEKIRPAFILVLAVYCLGLSYFSYERCKVWHDSITLWSDEIEKYPTLGMAYNNRGVAKQDLNDLDGALEDYKKCVEVNPLFYKAYNNKGIIESMKGNYQTAIKDFDKSISINNNYAEVYKNRGIAKYSFRDYKGAAEDYSFYLKSNPSHEEVLARKAVAEHKLNNYSNAISDYNKLIELSPGNVEAYSNRGTAKSALKNYPAAIADYNKALEINPSYSLAYYNRAKVEFLMGLNKEACADFQKAAEYGYAEAAKEFDLHCK